MINIIEKFTKSPVIPVLTLNDKNVALKIAESLIEGGLSNLEVTLRTKNAFTCIEAIKKEFPDLLVGAGTIIKTEQLQQIKNIGASFAVSPGYTVALVKEAQKIGMPYLPGASTPSEIIALYELGVDFQKFFHATNSGGYKMLKAYGSIFSEIKFCPTGGVGSSDFMDYLKLDNVLCLGGSWMVDMNELDYNNIKNIASSIFMNTIK